MNVFAIFVHSKLGNLHAEEGKDEDEEEEEEEEGEDGAHGVEEGDHQVAQACPVLGHLKSSLEEIEKLEREKRVGNRSRRLT